jgi:hypothetical protein
VKKDVDTKGKIKVTTAAHVSSLLCSSMSASCSIFIVLKGEPAGEGVGRIFLKDIVSQSLLPLGLGSNARKLATCT